jgi:hypothetical protein
VSKDEKNNGADGKNIVEGLRKKKVKKENKSICPYCNQKTEFIWVHGHYQCLVCKNVVTWCCGDE